MHTVSARKKLETGEPGGRTALAEKERPGRLVADRAGDERLRRRRSGVGRRSQQPGKGHGEQSGERRVVDLRVSESARSARAGRGLEKRTHNVGAQDEICSTAFVKSFSLPQRKLVAVRVEVGGELPVEFTASSEVLEAICARGTSSSMRARRVRQGNEDERRRTELEIARQDVEHLLVDVGRDDLPSPPGRAPQPCGDERQEPDACAELDDARRALEDVRCGDEVVREGDAGLPVGEGGLSGDVKEQQQEVRGTRRTMSAARLFLRRAEDR